MSIKDADEMLIDRSLALARALEPDPIMSVDLLTHRAREMQRRTTIDGCLDRLKTAALTFAETVQASEVGHEPTLAALIREYQRTDYEWRHYQIQHYRYPGETPTLLDAEGVAVRNARADAETAMFAAARKYR